MIYRIISILPSTTRCWVEFSRVNISAFGTISAYRCLSCETKMDTVADDSSVTQRFKHLHTRKHQLINHQHVQHLPVIHALQIGNKHSKWRAHEPFEVWKSEKGTPLCVLANIGKPSTWNRSNFHRISIPTNAANPGVSQSWMRTGWSPYLSNRWGFLVDMIFTQIGGWPA